MSARTGKVTVDAGRLDTAKKLLIVTATANRKGAAELMEGAREKPPAVREAARIVADERAGMAGAIELALRLLDAAED